MEPVGAANWTSDLPISRQPTVLLLRMSLSTRYIPHHLINEDIKISTIRFPPLYVSYGLTFQFLTSCSFSDNFMLLLVNFHYLLWDEAVVTWSAKEWHVSGHGHVTISATTCRTLGVHHSWTIIKECSLAIRQNSKYLNSVGKSLDRVQKFGF